MDTNLPLSNEIKKDATLDELMMTKQGWLDMAHQAGYPNICWEIVRWLGTPIYEKVSRGRPLLWEDDGIAVYGNEYILSFNNDVHQWEWTRSVSVYVAIPGSNVKAYTDFDKIVLNSNQVAYWSWSVFYDDKTGAETVQEETGGTRLFGNKNFFVNGSWILSVRNYIGQAQAKKEAHNIANTDKERQALLAEMLVGVNV